jgi:signal transduction histidine kinase
MPEHILYVDDDVANLTVLEAVFTPEIPVLTASSGQHGLELLQKHEVGVILCDQRMPGMSGVEVLEQAHRLRPEVVRIMITAYADINEAIAAINRGGVERYIRKPWQPEELKAQIRDALAVYRMRRKLSQLERRLVETERVYALGVVAAGIAHEMRTPLGVIVPSLELARSLQTRVIEGVRAGLTSGMAEPAQKVLDILADAATAAEHLTEITRGMELGQRRSASQRSCDLREVVALTIRMLRTEVMNKATVSVEASDGPATVAGSPAELGQVTLNLIVNALQAFPAPDAAKNRVVVRVRRTPATVQLEVEDNGPGIPPDVLERIFDPFFTTKEDGGTGLGLAISRRIVQELGGDVAVKSLVGEGTRFTVTLPAAAAA